ncbi:cilia- and flagella-associated protein 184-like isoform X2 [Tubulanus polymorphus]|uniref:cilia- and flagella-associated protein 184-like isoform X2 n=1 Tax=Tubulanus polymorphus TaxID=672921 RepID=UPI003DA565E6
MADEEGQNTLEQQQVDESPAEESTPPTDAAGTDPSNAEVEQQAEEETAPAEVAESAAAEGEGAEAPAAAATEETTAADNEGQNAGATEEDTTAAAEGEAATADADAAASGAEVSAADEGAAADAPADEAEQVAAMTDEATENGDQAKEGGDETETAATADGEAGEPVTAESQEEQPPKSDSFAEGERVESPVAVGERLSREGTPEPDEQMTPRSPPAILEPGTPDRYGSEDGEGVHQMDDLAEEDEDDDEYEEEEFQEFDREMLIEKYHAAISEREQLQQQNFQLQHKLAEYFRKKKADDTRQEMDKNVTDQEQRYLKYMSNLEDLRRQDSNQREDFKHQIEDLKDKCQDRQEKVDEERDRFMEFKKQVAISSVNTRSGKQIPQKDIEMYLATEAKKEAEVVNVRLENIKLKNKLKKKELQLKSKEELAEGLHLIDFEQLKIENQTYNEKIEERNEELLKLRKKITSTVQVLTHLKEKLQFVQGENQVLKGHLRDIEGNVAQKRDVLSRTKQARDALRIDNHKLRQNCGLLGNEPLLRDFEERKDEGADLRAKLEKLKMTHAELTLSTNGFRRKIEQAKNAELM